MRIAMIGSGYVGLVSGACFAQFGHDVVCVDKEEGKITRLRKGEMPIYEPGLDRLVLDNMKAGRLTFETDLRESLPGFYGDRGYIDFAVLRDTLVVDPQTGKARLVVDVSEGPRYRLGEFSIQGASHFPHEQLERLFLEQHRSVLGLPVGGTATRVTGEVFDRGALDAAAHAA